MEKHVHYTAMHLLFNQFRKECKQNRPFYYCNSFIEVILFKTKIINNYDSSHKSILTLLVNERALIKKEEKYFEDDFMKYFVFML